MGDDKKHAILSPSSAKRWMTCTASVRMCRDLPNESSKFADEGTLAHTISERMLTSVTTVNGLLEEFPDADHEMLDYCATYVRAVRDFAQGGEMFVEVQVYIGHLTGEEGAHGTSDAVIINDGELQVHDLKYGKGVRVEAEFNEQLMIYALGALDQYSLSHDIDRVRLVIHQPRLDSLLEWEVSLTELEDFREQVSDAAAEAISILDVEDCADIAEDTFGVTEEGCKFCKAKATCPALAAFVQTEVGDAFEDMTKATVDNVAAHTADNIGDALAAVPIIEDWCNAIRAKAESMLHNGEHVPGFKLVQGKKGNRKWSSEEEITELLKSFRLKVDEMYTLKVIGVPVAEKLLKANPKRWSKVEALVRQEEGKPTVVPESDKRPALDLNPAQHFDEVLA